MILSDEEKQSFSELFNYIYKGDAEASKVSFAVLETLHVWDDLIDQDKDIIAADINIAFLNALVHVGGSYLWTADMAANLVNVYVRWQDANSIERNPQATDNDLAKAWMLRAGCYDLFVLLAIKLHGLTWGEHVGPTVRAWYGETLQDFIEEIRSCQHQ